MFERSSNGETARRYLSVIWHSSPISASSAGGRPAATPVDNSRTDVRIRGARSVVGDSEMTLRCNAAAAGQPPPTVTYTSGLSTSVRANSRCSGVAERPFVSHTSQSVSPVSRTLLDVVSHSEVRDRGSLPMRPAVRKSTL